MKGKAKMNKDQQARADAKAKQIANMPMNKDFLIAKDDEGKPKYPIVDKLLKYKQLDYERIYDYMRQCSAFIAQIRHHENRVNRLSEMLKNDTLDERNEHGRILTREEVESEIINAKLAIPREISRIRECVVDKMLPLIDGIKFTGEQYNEYIIKCKDALESLGCELFPEKIELIFPEL